MTDLPSQPISTTDEADDAIFIKARFAGGRFDSHTIPFDVLTDLAAYRDLILEVAKKLYYDRHPDKKRVPKHFVSSFELGLARVEGGNSATAFAKIIDPIPESGRKASQRDLGFARYQEFEEARDLVDEFLDAVAANEEIPQRFPREAAARFNRFGQKLRSGEFIELTPPGRDTTRYTREVRKKAILSVFTSYENVIDGEQVFMLDGGQDSELVLHVKDSENRSFNFSSANHDQFDKAYSRRRHQVRLVGVGVFDKNDRLTKISSVEDIFYVDEQPRESFDERLNAIAQIEPGWYAEDAPAPDPSAIERLRSFLSLIVNSSGIPTPYIYPTAEGGVTTEWSLGDWETSATLENGSSILRVHALNIESDNELSKAIDLAGSTAIVEFISFWNEMEAE